MPARIIAVCLAAVAAAFGVSRVRKSRRDKRSMDETVDLTASNSSRAKPEAEPASAHEHRADRMPSLT